MQRKSTQAAVWVGVLAASSLIGWAALKAPSLSCSGSLEPRRLYRDTKDSIAVIRSASQQGSGFVVSHKDGDTYILTNSHVVDENNEVTVKWENRLVDKGYVVGDLGGYGFRNDLALVRVIGKRGKPLRFKGEIPEVGGDIVVIGAPQGLEFSLTKGVVSQMREKGDFVQVDAPVNPGNSGGPLIDKSGCVVGVVTFKKENAEGLTFAISAPIAKKFIKNPILARLDSDEPILQSKKGKFPEKLPKVPKFKNTDNGAGFWVTYFERKTEKDFYPDTLKSLKRENSRFIKGWLRSWEYQKDTVVKDGKWIWVLTRDSKTFEEDQRTKIGNDNPLVYSARSRLSVSGSHYGNTNLVGIDCGEGLIFRPEPWWHEETQFLLHTMYPTNVNEYKPGHSWHKKMGGVFYDDSDLSEGRYKYYLFSEYRKKRYSSQEHEENLAISIGNDRPLVSLYKTFCKKGVIIESAFKLSPKELEISKKTNTEADARSKD